MFIKCVTSNLCSFIAEETTGEACRGVSLFYEVQDISHMHRIIDSFRLEKTFKIEFNC